MAAQLNLVLLGTPRAFRDGAPLTGFVSSKAQALLFYLAMTARPHSRQALAALLWGEMPEPDARANLRVALFNLRRLVAEHLDIRRESVAFNCTSSYRIDVDAFQTQIGVTTEHDGALRRAVDSYRGEFLEGFHVRAAPLFEEWMLIQRERLRQLALQALYTLAQHTAEQGDYAAGIEYTTRLLAIEPWQEEAHRHLMLLLALSGQRSAALEQYRTCRRILATDLGVEPAEETTALYERIRRENRRPAAGAAGGDLHLPFVGRADEHLWLVRQCDEARQSRAITTLIEGETGIGKTRLAEELLHYAVGRGDRVLRGRCLPLADALPYQALADALRAALDQFPEAFAQLMGGWREALLQILPELAHATDAPPAGADELGSRTRLFEAIARCLLAIAAAGGNKRLILFIDDLQHADTATIDLLLSLAFRLEQQPIWLLGTCRVDPIVADHPATRLRRTLGREQRVAIMRLGPLAMEAVHELVGALPDIPPALRQQTADRLWHESEGNPFVLSQVIADRPQSPQFAATRVPFAVEEMILDRIERLSRPARRLLDLLAAAGPPVDLDVLLTDEANSETTSALEECVAHGLLRIEGATRAGEVAMRCNFNHVMTRRVIAARLPPWLRRSDGAPHPPATAHPTQADDLLRRLVWQPHDRPTEP
jgi:DNA-binding SARP family transcriptional activator